MWLKLLFFSWLAIFSFQSRAQGDLYHFDKDSTYRNSPIPLSYITPKSITNVVQLKDQLILIKNKTNLKESEERWDTLRRNIRDYLKFFKQVKYQECRTMVLYSHQKELIYWRDEVERLQMENIRKKEYLEQEFRELLILDKKWKVTFDTLVSQQVGILVISQVKNVLNQIKINQKIIREIQTSYIEVDGEMTRSYLSISQKIRDVKKYRNLELANLKLKPNRINQINTSISEFEQSKLEFFKTDLFYFGWVLKNISKKTLFSLFIVFLGCYLALFFAQRNIKYYPEWSVFTGSKGALRFILSKKVLFAFILVLLVSYKIVPTLSHYYEAALNIITILFIKAVWKKMRIVEVPYLWLCLLTLIVINVVLLPYTGVSLFEILLICLNAFLLILMIFGVIKSLQRHCFRYYKLIRIAYLYPAMVLFGLISDQFMFLYFPIDLAISLVSYLIQMIFLIRLVTLVVPIAFWGRTWFVLNSIFHNRMRVVVFSYKVLLIWGFFSLFRLPLKFLQLYDFLVEFFFKTMKWGFSLDQGSLTIGTVLVFITGIYLTLAISKILVVFFKEDIFNRFGIKADMASATLLLTRISFFSFGLYYTMLVAGINVSNFAVVLGALSVGIGFGLQGLVSNFISGLILMAERPVKLGDILELSDSTIGEIEEIGIRSSKIRKFDGSEMVVPNADLIANKFTNWTLTDERRRFSVIVGVAYGSDLKQVNWILESAVRSCDAILKNPQPQIVMVGFGESSLDFEVKAWVEHSWVKVRSQLLMDINKRFNENGIEIPFPQHDIHIKENLND